MLHSAEKKDNLPLLNAPESFTPSTRLSGVYAVDFTTSA
jgi:hypothetical protein